MAERKNEQRKHHGKRCPSGLYEQGTSENVLSGLLRSEPAPANSSFTPFYGQY